MSTGAHAHDGDVAPITAKLPRPICHPPHRRSLVLQAQVALPLAIQEPQSTKPIRRRHDHDIPPSTSLMTHKRVHGAIQRIPKVERPAVEVQRHRQHLSRRPARRPEDVQPQRRLSRPVLRHDGGTTRPRSGGVHGAHSARRRGPQRHGHGAREPRRRGVGNPVEDVQGPGASLGGRLGLADDGPVVDCNGRCGGGHGSVSWRK